MSCRDFKQCSDDELLQEILKTDQIDKDTEAAWIEFVGRFKQILSKAIISTCHRCAPHLSITREDVEDLVQHIYFKLFRRDCRVLRKFKSNNEDSLRYFLYDVARNVVVDRLRYLRAARRANISFSLDEPIKSQDYVFSISDRFPSKDANPEEQYIQKERIHQVQAFLDEEDDEQKREFLRRILEDYLEGYSLNEIAARNRELKRTAISERINLLKQKLQAIFKPK